MFIRFLFSPSMVIRSFYEVKIWVQLTSQTAKIMLGEESHKGVELESRERPM
jgi:hypothetical protein